MKNRGRPTPWRSAKVFRTQVRGAGVRVGSLTASSAWALFVSFLDVPFDVPEEPDSDGVLYQFGIYDFSGEPRFHFDLTMQFVVPDDDEYAQFHCDLQYLPTPQLRGLGSHSEWWWPDDGPDLRVWVDAINQRPEWAILKSMKPTVVEISCDGT